ncbi:hypothetical protein KR51_00012200 [Rubidibacter lacunae KORDI 51-2]|uniref:O-antigen ligase like membrane protein n=1 Tax=Rubidibacter lacunae KORDI 51-2 TaxID=582515 RepID=U5DR27_9CHRO|nr:hypothetical protein [Rubidibacter lacunae]ERN42130.1 hypothetical protein KR51_00012200 [Rubidibacter lacunae KORDI 51-2]
MGFLVPLALFCWIPVVLYLFTRLPLQRAVVFSFVAAWLFLPVAGYRIAGLPDLTKTGVTVCGVFLAMLLFDTQRLSRFSPSWLDAPMLLWCICPLLSSVNNGLGLYDGMTSSLTQTVTWGLPYFLGRLYLGNLYGLYQLALGICVGGILYVPLCLYEARMSPQLHGMLYGFHQHSFAHTMRYGGWRPVVFMQHGLEVGLWMMAATFIGFWLWRSGVLTKIYNIDMSWLVASLVLTTILVKSTGAYALLALGLLLMWSGKRMQTSLPILLVSTGICFYLVTNTVVDAPGYQNQIVTSLNSIGVSEARVGSIEFRFDNEKLLADKARQRLLFGWGGWGRSRVYDKFGRNVSTTDSLWIIAFGESGLVGLASLTATMLLPPLLYFSLRYRKKAWERPEFAPASAVALILVLYTIDCLLNAMVNPIFILANGALAGLVLQGPQLPIAPRSPKGQRQLPATSRMTRTPARGSACHR